MTQQVINKLTPTKPVGIQTLFPSLARHISPENQIDTINCKVQIVFNAWHIRLIHFTEFIDFTEQTL